MKRALNLSLVVFMLYSFNLPTKTKKLVIAPLSKLQSVELKPIKVKEMKSRVNFLNDIGFKESSNRYHIVNKFGYLGKYQFSKNTLRGLGYELNLIDFLQTPHIQEEAMLRLLKHNRKILRRYITKYQGSYHNDIFITESGILAAAHLGGPRNVKRWFKGIEFKDGLGTSISDYMKLFSNYELNLEHGTTL